MIVFTLRRNKLWNMVFMRFLTSLTVLLVPTAITMIILLAATLTMLLPDRTPYPLLILSFIVWVLLIVLLVLFPLWIILF